MADLEDAVVAADGAHAGRRFTQPSEIARGNSAAHGMQWPNEASDLRIP